MFVPTRVDTIEAKIVYGPVDEFGSQPVNIDIPGIGVLICEHDIKRGEIMDFGFDWSPETAYRAMFPGWADDVEETAEYGAPNKACMWEPECPPNCPCPNAPQDDPAA